MSTTSSDIERDSEKGHVYVLEVDGTEYTVHHKDITGAEIMTLAGIPPEAGLVQILEDGTQRPVPADEVIELKPGRRFKKRPRFKPG